MFFLILTASYFIPVIYLFFRLRIIFFQPKNRLKFGLGFWAVALVFPFSEIISHRDVGAVGQWFSLLAGYLVCIFLYLFLSVVVYDLFLLLNLYFKFVSKSIRQSSQYRTLLFSGMIFLSLLVTIGGIINLNTCRISAYQIDVPARHSRIDHLRIVFVADLHFGSQMRKKFLEQAAHKINSIHPDIVLFGGDMTEGEAGNLEATVLKETLGTIRSRYGSFAVAGNHEYHRSSQLHMFYDLLNITLLEDSVASIDSFFCLAGRNDPRAGSRKSLEELIGKSDPGLPLINLDHRPVDLSGVGKFPVDIQFSGHTHNGQLFPVNLIEKAFYELTWGYRLIGRTHFFVTSGLRLWGPQVKTAGKSEIMQVDVHFR